MDGVQLRGGSLLFATESSGVLDTHLIDIGGMKDWDDLEATQRFWTRNLWIGNPPP